MQRFSVYKYGGKRLWWLDLGWLYATWDESVEYDCRHVFSLRVWRFQIDLAMF